MSKKKTAVIFLCIFCMILANILIFKYIKAGSVDSQNPQLIMHVESDRSDMYQIFYTNVGEDFSDQNTDAYMYSLTGQYDKVSFNIKLNYNALRMDFGSQNATIKIRDAKYEVMFRNRQIDLSRFQDAMYLNDIASIRYENGVLIIETNGSDPYIIVDSQSVDFQNELETKLKRDIWIIDFILCFVLNFIVLVGIRHLKAFTEIPLDVLRERKLILTLAKNDFRTKFAGSYLGIVWAFIQPIVTVVVYWFVFQVGLRAGRVCEFPFILWLMAGLIPWFFFSEALNGGTNVLIEYNYLVKKVVFKISILPVVKMFSAVIVHLFFVAFVIIMCWIYGYTPDLYSLQILYYIFCTFIFTLGLVYITSSIVVFFRDLSQIIAIILQVGIWITPIMWDASSLLAPKYLQILKLNPLYYIVDGFRDALLGKTWFWDKGVWTIYFWLVTVAIFGIGVTLFRKLKVHFADVL